VVIGFVVGLFGIWFYLKDGNILDYMLRFSTLVALMIIIGYKKGEKPHWNWGFK